MTALATRRTKLTVETADTIRERGKLREVILEFSSPYYCTVRLKGQRTRYALSYGAIFNRAVALAVEKARAERKEQRRKKGASHGTR